MQNVRLFEEIWAPSYAPLQRFKFPSQKERKFNSLILDSNCPIFRNSSQISLPYILRVLYNQLRQIKAMISPTVLTASFAFANIDQKRPSIDVNVPAVACPAPVSSRLLSFSQLLPLLPFVFFLPLLLLFSFRVPRVSALIAHSATNRSKKNHENG